MGPMAEDQEEQIEENQIDATSEEAHPEEASIIAEGENQEGQEFSDESNESTLSAEENESDSPSSQATASTPQDNNTPIEIVPGTFAPKWLAEMHPMNIIALPYSEVPYTHDFYETALICLYKKKINFLLLVFFHFFIVSPIYWAPGFRFTNFLNVKMHLVRWSIVILLPTFILYYLNSLLYEFQFEYLFETLSYIILFCFSLFLVIGGWDEFRKWRHAYKKMSHQIKLNFSKPKKEKKKKKRK